MSYYIQLDSPRNYKKYSESEKTTAGFEERWSNLTSRLIPGDKLICYLTKFSRWVGVLEITGERFIAKGELRKYFTPYIIRFPIKSLVWLAVENAIPIKENDIWNNLSFTKYHSKSRPTWTGPLRRPLNQLSDDEGAMLERFLLSQLRKPILYPVDKNKYKKYFPQ